MIRVFLVDDHELVRRGIGRILAETRDIRVREVASTVAEARRRAESAVFPFDIVLLDISLPDGSGLDLIPALRARTPAVPVMVLSIHAEDRYAMQSFRKGAAGYFPKDGSVEALASAIRKVASGGRYVTPEIAERIVSDIGAEPARKGRLVLSDRELEVLRRIAAGQRSVEIAADLRLNVKTVATYKSRILRKTGLRSTAGIVRYADELGLMR